MSCTIDTLKSDDWQILARALSLVWLKPPAHNRVIVGSNPTGPIEPRRDSGACEMEPFGFEPCKALPAQRSEQDRLAPVQHPTGPIASARNGRDERSDSTVGFEPCQWQPAQRSEQEPLASVQIRQWPAH